MYRAVNQYLENEIKNASPLDLILMLYNKSLFCLKIAKKAIQQGLDNLENLRKKAENIEKATEIIAHLQSCLNFEKGGEIAKNLNEIYGILISELIKANLENNPETIEKAIITLENLKKAWENIKTNGNL